MPDVYTTIEEADEDVQRRLAEVLELRAAEPRQRAMLDDYLGRLDLADASRVCEIGCGTGAVSRAIAAREGVAEVVGIDPSPVFVARARELATGPSPPEFRVGRGDELPFDDGRFDAVVCHTVLSHVPDPEAVLAEARRVTAPGGTLAAFDGDYMTTTIAIAEHDPLQACADAAIEALVNDRTLVRRLPALVAAAGWELAGFHSHGYLETDSPSYMLTIAERGADALVATGTIGEPTAAALKVEARSRVERGAFFGHIAYASVIARAA